MPTTPTLTRLLSALGLLLLAGCAPAAGVQAGAEADASAVAEGHAIVRVQNNTIPPTSLTVWAVPQTGTRDMLGVVKPSETRTLHFQASGPATQYRLVAETTAGSQIVSREFTLAGTGGVTWNVSSNVVSPITR